MHRTWQNRAALALAIVAAGIALGAVIAWGDPECRGIAHFSTP